MGTITINIDDETEARFRETVKVEYGEGKGKLGAAFKDALSSWIKIKSEEEISQRQLNLMEKGFLFGKFNFDRDDLHERTN